MTIRQAVEKIGRGCHLTRGEARGIMELLLSGTVSDPDIISLLVALREKGEHPDELVGFAEVMRERAAESLRDAGVRFDSILNGEPLLDTCGTGGDGLGTFNVSTAVALVAASAGVRVAKHGNRSISSRCGSADVLETLGVRIDLPFERIPECLEKVGMVFLFAPRLHLAMRHVMNARRSLKTKTVFNLLGPLTNPLQASVQLVGVYDRARTEMMARALAAFGSRRAFVVAGHDGLDEISIAGPTQVSECCAGVVRNLEFLPENFGVKRATREAIAGGDPATNACLLASVLAGELGPCRDAVLVNAAAALLVSARVSSFIEGVQLAAECIDSGRARLVLDSLIEFTQKSRGATSGSP